MRIRWTPEASSNLENIILYIAENSQEAALKTANDVFQRIEQLVVFPHRGRSGREVGTHELVLSPLPYVAVYRVTQDVIEILRLWHGAQER